MSQLERLKEQVLNYQKDLKKANDAGTPTDFTGYKVLVARINMLEEMLVAIRKIEEEG